MQHLGINTVTGVCIYILHGRQLSLASIILICSTEVVCGSCTHRASAGLTVLSLIKGGSHEEAAYLMPNTSLYFCFFVFLFVCYTIQCID